MIVDRLGHLKGSIRQEINETFDPVTQQAHHALSLERSFLG